MNEGAASGPFNLNEYIQSPDAISGPVRFLAELANGASLPNGLICTSTGTLSGIPAIKTQGNYDVLIVAENDSGIALTVECKLLIKERIAIDASSFLGDVKSRVWEALAVICPFRIWAN